MEEDKVFGRMATLLTMRRTDPNGWLALAARDYKTRTPRDAEVIDETVGQLGEFFKNFEWSLKEDGELAGRRAQRLSFQGSVNHVLMRGECAVLTAEGFAYWFVTWGPAEFEKPSQREFAALPQGFRLEKDREGWAEQRPAEVAVQGTRAAYSLRYTEGLWTVWDNPKDVDPEADLMLQARDRAESKHVDKMARVVVLVLGPQPDLAAAARAARQHVEEQQRALYPKTKANVIRDPEGPQDRDAAVGAAAGHVTKLHVQNSPERERFVVLAVVALPKAVIAVQCECDLKRRSLWAADFKQLLATFKPPPS
jgi:hypothetical protein